jgi:2-C-methyl-D-erythritol 4-phosphate cytidylyltransferase
MPTYAVILAAAGRSSRFHDKNSRKPFIELNGKPVWLYSAELFFNHPDVRQLIIVISPDDHTEFVSRNADHIASLGIQIVLGGKERADSVENGLRRVNPEFDLVVIHDAARPCLDADLIERVFIAAVDSGAAIPAIPVNSTLKRSLDGKRIDETADRCHLYEAQTPQVFARELICDLYAKRDGHAVTDDSQLAEQHGVSVSLVEGSPLNLKITTQADLKLAGACLNSMAVPRYDAPIDPTQNHPRRR